MHAVTSSQRLVTFLWVNYHSNTTHDVQPTPPDLHVTKKHTKTREEKADVVTTHSLEDSLGSRRSVATAEPFHHSVEPAAFRLTCMPLDEKSQQRNFFCCLNNPDTYIFSTAPRWSSWLTTSMLPSSALKGQSRYRCHLLPPAITLQNSSAPKCIAAQKVPTPQLLHLASGNAKRRCWRVLHLPLPLPRRSKVGYDNGAAVRPHHRVEPTSFQLHRHSQNKPQHPYQQCWE